MTYSLRPIILCCLGLWCGLASANTLPPDTGVVNVRDHGAVGDGVADDTTALRAAVRFVLDREGRYASPPMLYLPDGTYRVTGTIEGKAAEHGWSGGWRAGLIVWGESRDRTIVRLDDNHPDFADTQAPRPIFITGSESDERTRPGDEPLHGGGNRAFRHSFMNLTIDAGAGNPGAVGIDYMAHNRGTIENVTIRSSDPQKAGHTGLKMTRPWPGPCLIKDVLVEGFDRGIHVGHFEYGNVFEDITLVDQRVSGLVNKQNSLSIHRLTSRNAVHAVHATDRDGLVVLVDAELTGGAADTAAIKGPGEFYLRDVSVQGYGLAVDAAGRAGAVNVASSTATMQSVREAAGRAGVEDMAATDAGGMIKLYTSERFAMGVEQADALRLPIRDTPQFWPNDPDQWVKPQEFLAGDINAPADGDWTDALQAALDSGKPAVYLPNGSYRVSRTLEVPPSVRLIVGFQSAITPGKDNTDKVDPLVRFVGHAGESTTLEHLWLSGHVEHTAGRAVAFRHVDIHGRYRNTAAGTGDAFFDDTIGPKPLLVEHPQRVFARQLNIEFGNEPLIENHGGTLWLLGYKTEGQMVCLKQTAGRTELLGGLLYPLRNVPGQTAAFDITGGEAALSFAMSGPRYPVPVRIRVMGGEQQITNGTVGGRSAALIRVRAGEDVVVRIPPSPPEGPDRAGR
ncbi:MAG: glycosyl hydrolase family 28-related protein [Phycisphaerae bacterium]